MVISIRPVCLDHDHGHGQDEEWDGIELQQSFSQRITEGIDVGGDFEGGEGATERGIHYIPSATMCSSRLRLICDISDQMY